MKSYGTLDFEGQGPGLRDLKIESGPVFPTVGLEEGFIFWKTDATGDSAGPYFYDGSAWLRIQLGTTRLDQVVSGISSWTEEHLAAEDPHPQYQTEAESGLLYSVIDHSHAQYSTVVAQEVVVQKDPGPGQFSSLAAALDSIIDATSTKPYLISMAAGVYVEPAIFMKPWVFVSGRDPGATTIEAQDPNSDLIIGCNKSAIVAITLSGATGSGAAAISFADADENLMTLGFFVRHVRFGSNSIQVKCSSTSKTTNVFLSDCRFGSTFSYDKAFVCTATNSGASRIIVRASTTNGATAPFPTDFAYVSGTGAEIMFIACIFWSSVTTPTGTGIHVRDGGVARLTGTHLRGYGCAIWSENVGTASTVLAHNVSLEGNVFDMAIDHPGTLGAFTGSAARSKVSVHASSPMSIFYTDGEANGINVVGALNIGASHADMTDVTSLIQESSPYGIIRGGVINTTEVALQVAVGAGYGYVEDAASGMLKRVNWPDMTILVPDDTNSYIYLDDQGSLCSATSKPVSSRTFELGRVRTRSGSIVFISAVRFEAMHAASALKVFLRNALGPVYATGSLVTENTTTAYALDVGAGHYWYSSTSFEPVGGTAIAFRLFYHVSGVVIEDVEITVVDNAHYDNGTDLATLSTGYYTKHVLYVSGDGSHETYGVVYGDAEYASLLEAQQGPLPAPPAFFAEVTTPIAAIIVRQGAANITQIIDIRPRMGFQSPSTTGAGRHGDLLGLDGDDHPQYLRTSGERALIGDLDLGLNSLINVGSLNNITVESHESRHLPNGEDAIATETAVGLSDATTSSAGVANSLARSDHTHAITGFVPENALGAAGGAATLNASGYVPVSQINPVVFSIPDQSGHAGDALLSDGVDQFWGGAVLSHGFPDRTSATMTYDQATRTLTLSQTGGLVYWFKGRKVVGSATMSLQHAATRGTYFYMFDDASGTLEVSTTSWVLDQHVPACFVYWDGSKGLACEERHGHQRNIPLHVYLHTTIGTKLVSGLVISSFVLESGVSNSDVQWALTSGVVADEDIQVATSSVAAAGPYIVFYRDSATPTWAYSTTSTVPYKVGTAYAQYDNNGTPTDLSSGQYVNYWIYGTTKLVAPHVLTIMGQVSHTTLDSALAEPLAGLNLSGFPLKECVPLYKITLRADSAFTTSGKVCIFFIEAIDAAYKKSKQPIQYLDLVGTTEPAAPPQNHLAFYAQSRGGRLLPHWVENNGLESAVQPALFGNSIAMWLPGTSNLVSISFGAAFSILVNGSGATQTHPTLSPTNPVTQMKRASFSTGSSSGGNSGIISTAALAWRGNAAHLGGFFFFARLALEAYATDERFFVGLSANTGAMNGINPSSWNNTIGIGKDTTDSQLYILSRDATAVTKVSTGITPNAAQILDFQIFCKPNDNKVTIRIFDPAAGAVLVNNLVVSTNLPVSIAFMYMQAQIESVTGTAPKMLSLNRMYLESDI